jgi:molybdate transport system substrate-binding protein
VGAAEIKVLTTGAFKQVVLALVPDFEKQTGNKVVVDNDTAGALKKRIEGGEAFDVAVITPVVVDELAAKGKIASGIVSGEVELGLHQISEYRHPGNIQLLIETSC